MKSVIEALLWFPVLRGKVFRCPARCREIKAFPVTHERYRIDMPAVPDRKIGEQFIHETAVISVEHLLTFGHVPEIMPIVVQTVPVDMIYLHALWPWPMPAFGHDPVNKYFSDVLFYIHLRAPVLRFTVMGFLKKLQMPLGFHVPDDGPVAVDLIQKL